MFEELLSHSGLSFDRLRNFLRVVEAGSISKAADGDEVRQSLYSRQIAELKDFFGVELTERRGKGIAISPAGQRLAVLIRESLQSLEDFKKEQADQTKQFAIGSGSSALNWLVAPCLHEIVKHLSGARVRLESHRSRDAIAAVREGRLDFAVVREDAVPGEQSREKIAKVMFMLCVPKALSARHNAKDKGDWRTLPIATALQGGNFRTALDAAAANAGVEFKPAVECASFLEVRKLVAAGQFAGILPSHGVGGLARQGVDVRPFAQLKDYGRALCLHWNNRQMARRGVSDHAIKAISATLKKSFANAEARSAP